MKKIFLITAFLSFFWCAEARDSHGATYTSVSIDRRDRAAQERGAAIFMNTCSGCHSLKQIRYTDLARHFGWVDDKTDRINEDLINQFLKFHDLEATSPILPALTQEQAEVFFGKKPPDLSLVLRYRSAQWVSDMLHGYFYDPQRPTGVNNRVFENTAMPHVLIYEQGFQPYKVNGPSLEEQENTPALSEDYEKKIHDLIAFLDYVAEPKRLEREVLGKYVILFCMGLSVIYYLYYRAIWEDVDKH